MPIYSVPVTIHDGEHEYLDDFYVFAKDEKDAMRKAMENFSFNDEQFFGVEEEDENGNPKTWVEKHGYRIYEFESGASLFRLQVWGLNTHLDINELMRRPVLPLKSSDAEWVWFSPDNHHIFWWYMGEYYVWTEVAFEDTDQVYTGTFNSYELDKEYREMLKMGFSATKHPDPLPSIIEIGGQRDE